MNAAAIAHALGHAQRTGDGWIASCPVASHGQGKGDRHPSLSIADGEDGILVHCHSGCDPRDVLDELRHRGLLDDRRGDIRMSPRTPRRGEGVANVRHPDERKATQAIASRLWDEAREITGTLAEVYLIERRGLDVRDLDLSHVLRWQSGIGAVVALMTDAISNEPVGVHRTFLDPDGAKRERKMLGHAGVIRLTPDEDVTIGLGIVEGIETGLRVLLSGFAPVWAAGSAGGIRKFPTLAGIEALTIFTDADPVGQASAEECASRWQATGREVRMMVPP